MARKNSNPSPMPTFESVFAQAMQDREDPSITPIGERLELADGFIKDYHNNPDMFQVGDLVTWKEGMRNKKSPEYGEPIIIFEVFDTTFRNTNDNGTPYSLEPLHGRALVQIDNEDGELMVYPIDFNRFKLVKRNE